MAANVIAAGGFGVSRTLVGFVPNENTRSFPIAYNLANKIANGDPVKLVSASGTLDRYAFGDSVAGSPLGVLGIFSGCKYRDPSTGREQWFDYWAAPTLASTIVVEGFVECDPDTTWQCQAQGTAITQSSVGRNIEILTGTSGVPTGGIAGTSTCLLDVTTIADTVLPFRIMRIVPSPCNGAPFGYNELNDNQILEVAINNSPLPTGTRTGQA